MKKQRRETPEQLTCAYCGAVKHEITFTIGACSKDKPDWCMVYGTGKIACPACYAKGQAEADTKINKHIAETNAAAEKLIAPAPGPALAALQAQPTQLPVFESKDAQLALRPIIETARKAIYTLEYQDKATDAEILGVILAKFFEWDGTKILATAVSGLEDANYHSDASEVQKLLDSGTF